MKTTDQLNRTIEFSFPPKRIVSLVPSQSELLWYLGLEKELVGITKFCIHPNEMFKETKHVGGTKAIKIELIRQLSPDLIIANKEENEQSQIEKLAEEFPVWISDIHTLEDALRMIEQVGIITDRKIQSGKLTRDIQEKFQQFSCRKPEIKNNKATYLIWKKPYMAAGHTTFIHDMLKHIGFNNVFSALESRYPEISLDDLISAKPDFVFLSSEPYPFKEKHVEELKAHLPYSQIILVDGEMFSWYGSRLSYAFDYFTSLLKEINF